MFALLELILQRRLQWGVIVVMPSGCRRPWRSGNLLNPRARDIQSNEE
jgi:hypothetical protein